MAKKIAVVIPCYNEAATIAEVIANFPREQLAQLGFSLDVLVIDNNSTDGTADIARKFGATVIPETKQGKGNAMRTGFAAVPDDTDYVVMIDGDNTYNPAEILRIVEPLQNEFCDVVIGSRLGGRIRNAAMSRTSRFGNRLFTAAVRFLYGANVTDVLSGYFAWKKSAIDALAPHIVSSGFAIEMEMITKMAWLGQQMAAVPISYHPRRSESHLHPFKDGMRILLMLLRNVTWHPTRNAQSPRRIVFVSDTIYPYMKGGKEKRLHEITKRLATMGNEVHIYTMHWWKEPAKIRQENGVYLHALCKYHELYKGDRRTIKEGVIFGLSCLKLLRAQFDVLDVDHMPFFPIFSAWLVCLLRRRKMHATWHEALSRKEWTSYMGAGGLLASLVERLSIRLPHRITAASAHTREQLAHLHGRVEGVALVTSGIDTELINTVTPTTAACDVLYVGRLVKDKNVDKLIAALDIVRHTSPDIRCVIIGRGLEYGRLRRMVAKYSLEPNVTFVGMVPDAKDVYAYMKAARVFCTPSVREGFGIVSLEALACGTPVITTDSPHNAARFLIEDGVNGSVVALDPQAFAQAILKWTAPGKKPNLNPQMADYDWRTVAKQQAEVYTQ